MRLLLNENRKAVFLITLEQEITYLFFRLKHEESELKTKQAELKSTAKGYEKDKAALNNLIKDRNKLEVCWI